MNGPTLAEVLEAVHALVVETWGRTPRRLIVELLEGDRIELPIPAPRRPAGAARTTADMEAAFVPTPFQEGILMALEGKALRTDALGAAVGDRSRLFRHPGGIKELREQGLVSHHPRLGFFSVEAPPPQLLEEEEDTG